MTDFQKFNKSLLSWYKKNARSLPWRQTHEPYMIWVSEIMSQQTQIERVAENFYPCFIKRFPSVEVLAKAQWEEVFEYWDGLGYYSRGKNLLKSAKIIQKHFNGQFPQDMKTLETLPGIGGYTSAAILSFAFDKKIPAIDTNVSKIVSILWPQEKVVETAKNLIALSPSGRDWNSAMMDLASYLRSGKMIAAPLDQFFPPDKRLKFIPQRSKPKKQKIPKKNMIEVGVACIYYQGKYLIQSRPEDKSFAGLWEFPGGKREKGEDFRTCVKREILEELGVEISVRPHFFAKTCRFNAVDLHLRFHRSQIQRGEPKPLENQKIQWVTPEEFEKIQFLPTNAEALEKLKKMRV